MNGQVERILPNVRPIFEADACVHALQALNHWHIPLHQGQGKVITRFSIIPLCFFDVGKVLSAEANLAPHALLEGPRNRSLGQPQWPFTFKGAIYAARSIDVCAPCTQVQVENDMGYVFWWDLVINPITPALGRYFNGLRIFRQEWT